MDHRPLQISKEKQGRNQTRPRTKLTMRETDPGVDAYLAQESQLQRHHLKETKRKKTRRKKTRRKKTRRKKRNAAPRGFERILLCLGCEFAQLPVQPPSPAVLSR